MWILCKFPHQRTGCIIQGLADLQTVHRKQSLQHKCSTLRTFKGVCGNGGLRCTGFDCMHEMCAYGSSPTALPPCNIGQLQMVVGCNFIRRGAVKSEGGVVSVNLMCDEQMPFHELGKWALNEMMGPWKTLHTTGPLSGRTFHDGKETLSSSSTSKGLDP